MEIIAVPKIDWESVSLKLYELRVHNLNLRRYVCFYTRNHGDCHSLNCLDCKKNMDRAISQSELGEALGWGLSSIQNWETGRSKPSIEVLIYYAQICQISLEEILGVNLP